MPAREIAESCLDLLNMELVACYSRQQNEKADQAGRRIEAIGYQVGQQLVERFTKERPRFGDPLEVIKFICKDFWAEVFKKQVDNLKTNHRGVFVLQDNRFRWLTRISVELPVEKGGVASPLTSAPTTPKPDAASPQLASKAAAASGQHLHFPCGLIRGALTNLGVHCIVTAEVSTLPSCSFTVRTKQ